MYICNIYVHTFYQEGRLTCVGSAKAGAVQFAAVEKVSAIGAGSAPAAV